jgi:hypothetical protein
MIKAKSEYGFNGLPLALRALSEAMQWLRAKGLLRADALSIDAQSGFRDAPRLDCHEQRLGCGSGRRTATGGPPPTSEACAGSRRLGLNGLW